MVGFNQALFYSKVDKTDTCWLWTGYTNKDGYGEYTSPHLTTRLAHRISYALDNDGALPDLPLDHLCRNKTCVHPDHLEPVTHKVNIRRSDGAMSSSTKTECPQGHPYDARNTLVYDGKRVCRTCKNERNRARRKRERDGRQSDVADA